MLIHACALTIRFVSVCLAPVGKHWMRGARVGRTRHSVCTAGSCRILLDLASTARLGSSKHSQTFLRTSTIFSARFVDGTGSVHWSISSSANVVCGTRDTLNWVDEEGQNLSESQLVVDPALSRNCDLMVLAKSLTFPMARLCQLAIGSFRATGNAAIIVLVGSLPSTFTVTPTYVYGANLNPSFLIVCARVSIGHLRLLGFHIWL